MLLAPHQSWSLGQVQECSQYWYTAVGIPACHSGVPVIISGPNSGHQACYFSHSISKVINMCLLNRPWKSKISEMLMPCRWIGWTDPDVSWWLRFQGQAVQELLRRVCPRVKNSRTVKWTLVIFTEIHRWLPGLFKTIDYRRLCSTQAFIVKTLLKDKCWRGVKNGILYSFSESLAPFDINKF
jgi:hypothetical protein